MTQTNPLKDQIKHLKKYHKKNRSLDPKKKFFEFNPYLKVAIERTIVVEAKDYDDACNQMIKHWKYIIGAMGLTLGDYAEDDEHCTEFSRPFIDEEHEGTYSKTITNLELLKPMEWEPSPKDEPLRHVDWVLWSDDYALNGGRLDIDSNMNSLLSNGHISCNTEVYCEFDSKGKEQYKRMKEKEDV